MVVIFKSLPTQVVGLNYQPIDPTLFKTVYVFYIRHDVDFSIVIIH